MDRLEDDIPCYKKKDCDAFAVKQLLALSVSSSEYPKEYGDPGYPPTSCKRISRQKYQPVKEKEVTNETHEEKSQARLTTADMYLLRLKENNENGALVHDDFCGWQLCPTIHAETVKHGIVDASRLKPRNKIFNAIHRSVNSATGKLSARTSTPPSKLKTCLSTRLDCQRPSSVSSHPSSSNNRKEELGVWQEPPPPVPIEYNFKYLKHPRQYSDQYREAYTYTKMKEKSLGRCSFIGGVIVPRQRMRCVKGKAMISGKLSSPSSTPTCSDPDQVKSSMINWQLNHQLVESCDVELSVNNPSPTEIAMLSKIPHIHRSSPSIPSNTNGKYGGKGTDKPYPFQLNISADAQTVIAPTVKKCGHPIFIH
ncbi:uncharacterized protein LOC119725812 [Patiria miniata]|uniref:Uncharacterized protein n=1 Tax=Patiria miniata TaxID=46514 RepID=A0A913ZNL3_PATMI|nr:uncharacterized protein LOC119725812 [Patiria miniata]XP_038053323.1 uncharacterized protein LOC119725812 [Patiria miniata]